MSREYKVVLLGDGRVGKTSLLSRFLHGTFDAHAASTIQARMYTVAHVPLLDGSGASVRVHVWDTAGQERFHALGPIYYRHANGACVVYDTTDADTLEAARRWLGEVRAIAGEGVAFVLCGNKADRARDAALGTRGEALAAAHGAKHLYTSAKTGQNVMEAFSELATAVVGREGKGERHGRRKRYALRLTEAETEETMGETEGTINGNAPRVEGGSVRGNGKGCCGGK